MPASQTLSMALATVVCSICSTGAPNIAKLLESQAWNPGGLHMSLYWLCPQNTNTPGFEACQIPLTTLLRNIACAAFVPTGMSCSLASSYCQLTFELVDTLLLHLLSAQVLFSFRFCSCHFIFDSRPQANPTLSQFLVASKDPSPPRQYSQQKPHAVWTASSTAVCRGIHRTAHFLNGHLQGHALLRSHHQVKVELACIADAVNG